MSRRLVAVALSSLLSLAAAQHAMAGEDARMLMGHVWTRFRGLETEREELSVFVVSAPGKDRYLQDDLPALSETGSTGIVVKRAVRSIRYDAAGEDRLHILLSEPAEDKGTGFLMWRKPAASQDDQWLYLPALKRVRRIAASGTQTFVGSNFNYEDIRSLTSEVLDRFRYELAGEDSIDGVGCTLVRATPKEGTTSIYGSRTIAIAKDSLFPLRTQFLNDDGTVRKLLTQSAIREVAPGVWRPGLVEMRDLKLGETTVISFDKREVNPDIPPNLFTQDALERGEAE